MKLGLGSYACSWEIGVAGSQPAVPLTASGFLERAASLGLELAQIADNLPLEKLPAEDLTQLRRRAVELGVAIELGTRGIAPDHVRSYIRLCGTLESTLLRVVVDSRLRMPLNSRLVKEAKDDLLILTAEDPSSRKARALERAGFTMTSYDFGATDLWIQAVVVGQRLSS